MCDSGTKTQLELVAVDGPAMTRCRNDRCDGHVHWLHDDEMPRCKVCSQVHWFREVADKPADAQTSAMLEGVIEAAKRGAARGADAKPKDIAEAVCTGEDDAEVRVGDMVVAEGIGMVCADEIAGAINKAHEAQVNTDAKTIADLERQLEDLKIAWDQCNTARHKASYRAGSLDAEVKTLGETIVDRDDAIMHYKRDGLDHAATVARLIGEATPAPPADSREAFEAYAQRGMLRYGETGNFACAQDAWLAALAWRGSKTKRGSPFAWYKEEGGRHLVYFSGVGCLPASSAQHAKMIASTVCAAVDVRSKPKRIAEVVHGCIEGSGELIVCGVYVAAYGIKSIAEGDADRINKNCVTAHGCEEAK